MCDTYLVFARRDCMRYLHELLAYPYCTFINSINSSILVSYNAYCFTTSQSSSSFRHLIPIICSPIIISPHLSFFCLLSLQHIWTFSRVIMVLFVISSCDLYVWNATKNHTHTHIYISLKRGVVVIVLLFCTFIPLRDIQSYDIEARR